MMTVSEYLKTRREEIGLNLHEVSIRMNVKQEYLQAIESGNDKFFGSDVYRKGFVKLYAKFLGLDEAYAAALDRRTHQVDLNKGIHSVKTGFSLLSQKYRLTFFTVITFLFLAVLGGVVYFQFQNFNDSPNIKIISPITQEFKATNDSEEINLNYTSPTEQIDIVGNVEPDVRVYINSREQNTDKLGTFSIKNKVLFNGDNTFEIEAVNSIGKKTLVKLTVKYIR